jgi:hypothetical protein
LKRRCQTLGQISAQSRDLAARSAVQAASGLSHFHQPNTALRQERHKESSQTPLSDPRIPVELPEKHENRCHMMFFVSAARLPCISWCKTGISGLIRRRKLNLQLHVRHPHLDQDYDHTMTGCKVSGRPTSRDNLPRKMQCNGLSTRRESYSKLDGTSQKQLEWRQPCDSNLPVS